MTELHDDDLVPFGRHTGKFLREMPAAYWQWFVRQKWADQWPDMVRYGQAAIVRADTNTPAKRD